MATILSLESISIVRLLGLVLKILKIKYPRAQMEQGVSGKVFIQFIIDTLGVVNNIRILRGVDPSIDAEAIRVIKLSPLWLPAKQNGRKVKQEFTIPLNFELPKKE